jgi:hypothetical protein
MNEAPAMASLMMPISLALSLSFFHCLSLSAEGLMNEAPAMASLMMPISRSFIRSLSFAFCRGIDE